MLGGWTTGPEPVLDNYGGTRSPYFRTEGSGYWVQQSSLLGGGSGLDETLLSAAILNGQSHRVHNRVCSGLTMKILLAINSPGPEATFMDHTELQGWMQRQGLGLLCMAKRGELVNTAKVLSDRPEEDRPRWLSAVECILGPRD